MITFSFIISDIVWFVGQLGCSLQYNKYETHVCMCVICYECVELYIVERGHLATREKLD